MVRNACFAGMILTVAAILGTYSRGGLIALVVVFAALWWRTQRHLLTAGFLVTAAIAILVIFPQKWNNRMATIETYDSDDSFQSRVDAWKTALRIGFDRPFVGAGYRATEETSIYARYNPENKKTHGRAVHSVYFEVLADHGFVGFGLFAFMLFLAFRNCRWVAKKCSSMHDLQWLAYLASMLEVGFIGYAVGGAALSVAYYDVFLVLIVVSSLLRDYAQREVKALDKSGNQRAPQTVPRFAMATSKS
jgi:probable O-glycosylation ligase (exosortase A-associated)